MPDIEIGKINCYEDKDEEGKAVWEFEGKLTTDTPLLTEAQDIAGAINELKKELDMEEVISERSAE